MSDSRLLEISNTTGWGCQWDITEFVTFHFTRLERVKDWRNFIGIYVKLGYSDEEVFINKGTLLCGVTANDKMSRKRSLAGKKPIRNEEDIENLVGKTYFISRIIRGHNIFGNGKVAYRMHKLTRQPQKNATIIREAMCAAKIEMLERIIAWPDNPELLDCTKGFFDYETPIRQAIEAIRHYPETEIPKD